MPPEPPSVRTVVVRSPSQLREAGQVVRAVLHIVWWSALVMGAPWLGGRGFAGATTRAPAIAVDEVALRDLDAESQRLYRRSLDGLAAAEDARARVGDWPSVDVLAARQVPPFARDPLDRAGYRWRMLREGTVINYVGAPGAASKRPTLVISIVEPDPGTPIDPLAIVDETHHKLRDGTLLHVSIWTGERMLDRPAATPAFEDGWRRITVPTVPTVPAGPATPAVLAVPAVPAAPAVAQVAAPALPTVARPLRVGVTLHPYYSWVANVIAGVPGAEVVAVLPGEIDAGNYQPSPGDIARLGGLDAIVENGIGHDDFVRDMISASGNTHLAVIEANAETPLVPSAHGDAPNSHTFISFGNAIQQTQLIARKLGELRPESADAFAANAAVYAGKLRALQAAAADRLAGAKIKRVVTVHDGYTYLLQEFGVALAGVVQPAHGLTPSAKELADMIDLMKRERVTIVFTEEDFPDKLLRTLQDATGARVYIISHVAVGSYSASEFETVMAKNAEALVAALVSDPP